jgi:hypothetical protein
VRRAVPSRATERRAWEVPCMGRHLSSASVPLEPSFCSWPNVGAERRRLPSHTDWERGRVEADSREAGARKREPLTRSTSSPPANGGYHTETVNPSGAPNATGRGTLAPQPCIDRVAKTHDHDAVMRISGEAPRQRDHSVECQKPGISAVHRHLGSRSDTHLSLENAASASF